MNFDWGTIVSSLAGSSVAGFLIRTFIGKILRDLESAINKIALLQTELAKITVKLEAIEKTNNNILQIDRKLAFLEMRIYGDDSSVSETSIQ
jgi:hypothetical protein